MLTGREYGAGSSDCPTCETHSPTLDISQCGHCDKPGCNFCLTEVHGVLCCSECAEPATEKSLPKLSSFGPMGGEL